MTQTPGREGNAPSSRPAQESAPSSGYVRTPRSSRATKQPIGISPELRDRQEQYRSSTQDRRATAVYDDLHLRTHQLPPQYTEYVPKPPRKHTGLWAMIMLLCWLCIGSIGLFVAPQLLGIHFASMPNYAFVNGSIVAMNPANYEEYVMLRNYMDSDAIYPGVYIDGVDVGGMTRAQAIEAVAQVSPTVGSDFSINIQVGNGTWLIDSTMVPMTRNIAEIVDQAYALGRGNTTAIRGSSITPFQERLNAAMKLRIQPQSYSTELTYDKSVIRGYLESIVQYVNCEPVNASVESFNFNTHTFSFSSDLPGAYIDLEELYQRVTGCLDSGNYYTTVKMEPEAILASVTKAELMNSFRLISSYTTSTTSNSNRNTNINLSAQAISGRTVAPGETFSFNQATGQRSYEKGYREATAISGGQNVPEIGGGVCQTSSTLFNAVARANLEIVSRSPHAWPSSYVDKGMDATVNWPGLDFKFKNNTEWPIFIVAKYANRKVTVEIYGMTLGDGITIDLESTVVKTLPAPSEVKYVQNTSLPVGTQKNTVQARTGYVVETYKVWYQNGREIKRELLCKSTYKAYQKTIEWN